MSPEIAVAGRDGSSGASIDDDPHVSEETPALDAATPERTPGPSMSRGPGTDAAVPERDPEVAEALPEEQEVSALTAPQVYALCQEVDRLLGVAGDIAASCRVEAWLSSMSQEGCDAVLADCLAAGESGLGLELGTPCEEQTISTCEATVEATLACAEENGRFFRARSCSTDNLREATPSCSQELSMLCPSLFGHE